MHKGLVFVSFDLWCDWTGNPPAYRLYLDDELVTERNYTWNNPRQIIEERIPAHLTTGEHRIKIENLDPNTSKFTIRNFQINDGSQVKLVDSSRFVLHTSDLN